jgi:hypothetical protein
MSLVRASVRSRILVYGARTLSYDAALPVISIPGADVYPLGRAARADALFRDLRWAVRDGEAWAIVGGAGDGAGKTVLLDVRPRPSPRAPRRR